MRIARLGSELDGHDWQETLFEARSSDGDSPGERIEWLAIRDEEWESLLTSTDVDAVFLGGADEQRLTDQVRQLLNAGVPVLLPHPAAGVLVAYEWEMIRLDTRGFLQPLAPFWFHPAWTRLAPLDRELSDRIGPLEQIVWERTLAERRREVVHRELTRDIELIRRMLGTVAGVNSVGTLRTDEAYASLGVHFTGESGVTAAWSLHQPAELAMTRVKWIGRDGLVELRIPVAADGEWTLLSGDQTIEVYPAGAAAIGLRRHLREALASRVSCPTWNDACLGLEISEAVEKSWRRKRGVDLHTGERSEEKTFKGFMAAGGCLILVVVLLSFLGFALWDGVRAPFREQPTVATSSDRDGRVASEVERWPLWARLWPVYPLAGFLALQLLLNLARSGPARSEREP